MSSKRQKKKQESRDDGLKKGGGVNYAAINDRQVADKRHERERDYKLAVQELGVGALKKPQQAVSSTFDAFQRMAAGLEGRKLEDKMNDPNRPTWEQYKKDNEDKLDCVSGEARKMVEYRAELDRERDRKLANASKSSSTMQIYSDDDAEESSSDHGKKKKKKKKDKKKHKKSSKKRKREKGGSDSSSSSDEEPGKHEVGGTSGDDVDKGDSMKASNVLQIRPALHTYTPPLPLGPPPAVQQYKPPLPLGPPPSVKQYAPPIHLDPRPAVQIYISPPPPPVAQRCLPSPFIKYS